MVRLQCVVAVVAICLACVGGRPSSPSSSAHRTLTSGELFGLRQADRVRRGTPHRCQVNPNGATHGERSLCPFTVKEMDKGHGLKVMEASLIAPCSTASLCGSENQKLILKCTPVESRVYPGNREAVVFTSAFVCASSDVKDTRPANKEANINHS